MGAPVVCATISDDETALISPIGAVVRLWVAVVVMLRMRVLYCRNDISRLAWLPEGTRESMIPTLSTRRVSSVLTYAWSVRSRGAPSTLCEHMSISPGKRLASGGLPIHSRLAFTRVALLGGTAGVGGGW